MNFKQLSDWQLTEDECSILKRLSETKDFLFFRDYIEKKLLKTSYDVMVGTPVEAVDRIELLDQFRGAARMWKEIMWKLDNIKTNETTD